MKSLKTLYAICFAASVISCGKNEEPAQAGESLPSFEPEAKDSVYHPHVNPYENASLVRLRFTEFEVAIDSAYVFNQDDALKAIHQTDSLSVELDIGATIEGQKIRITREDIASLSVEQRYETSVTIGQEGPHCDLTDWKHYYSEWEALPENADGSFTGKKYTVAEMEKFPEVPLEELHSAILKNCGDEDLDKIKSPTDYPSEVGISRVFLRITATHTDGTKTVKIITFDIPMGC